MINYEEVKISHDRNEETPEAKARWFQALTINERAELLTTFTDLIMELNPEIVEKKRAEPVAGRILVLKKS